METSPPLYEVLDKLVADHIPDHLQPENLPGLVESALPERLTVEGMEETEAELKSELTATFASLVQLAKNPDSLVAGAITGDPLVTAEVRWPGDVPGLLTITARHSSGAVTAYSITYGSPVTKTFTQPAISRTTSGAPTNVPQIVVS